MKRQRDAVVAALGLVLGVAAMAGTLFTDEFAHAAGAEARGYDALFHKVATGEQAGQHLPAALAPTALMACNEVDR